ncbi:hypothetical protein PHYSODRAFT_498431 [Phytophthora sojae]|uniref:FYVE-type domain-containing protein n=1 Tax=Phytophthora sojae (strain P6497) TaxID=1094619 RepID=G4ZJI8_PHYSP|nr:hypothetical protein PHYSODRAFT_498431 [Phytophthora sojae]EGZ18853.1 hypothetical protein PHYSODRAFT_498431 [Phytophthora sojae]|eukprot:XP_009527911.1 hypothetical protein PHYSODRAFT_498431 [Phytophthora sojae]
MKFTLPRDALPAVTLTKEQQAAFIEESDTVVRETLAANEEFLAGGATFRDPKWKMVRVKEGLSVYCERRSRSKESKAQRTAQNHSSNSSCIQDQMKTPNVSLMVLHGSVEGNLADCMYGTFAPTNQAWMWRSSHLNDRLDDARVLSTIRGPTRKDPFRFLGIKWFAKEIPAVLSGIVQQRDYLMLEATGLTRDSRGDTVGYYILHSVSLPEVPELSELGIVRGQMSLCFIDRQNDPGKVEIYCRGFSDPAGEMIDQVNVAITADSLISAAGVIDYAYIKKLTWLIKHKGASTQSESGGFPRPSRCETCDKSFSKFALAGVGSGIPCHICRRVVCGKCSVVKKMTVDVSSTGSVKQCALRFCLECIIEAKEKSVWELALSAVENSSECSSTSSSE